MENNQIVSTLNELLVKNHDAKAGYHSAAEKVEHSALKAYLNKRANDRNQFGNQLEQEITNLGGSPEEKTSIAGDIHRAWIGLRDAFTAGDSSVYNECVRGEKAFVEEYSEALNDTTLPHNVKQMIQEQKSSAEQAIVELEAMSEFA